MSAGFYDMVCEQYATFTLSLVWLDKDGNPINLTGYHTDMIVADALKNEIIKLSDINGRIALGTTNGKMDLTITAADTSSLPPGNYQYDLIAVAGTGAVSRVLQGGFPVVAGNTPS